MGMPVINQNANWNQFLQQTVMPQQYGTQQAAPQQYGFAPPMQPHYGAPVQGGDMTVVIGLLQNVMGLLQQVMSRLIPTGGGYNAQPQMMMGGGGGQMMGGMPQMGGGMAANLGGAAGFGGGFAGFSGNPNSISAQMGIPAIPGISQALAGIPGLTAPQTGGGYGQMGGGYPTQGGGGYPQGGYPMQGGYNGVMANGTPYNVQYNGYQQPQYGHQGGYQQPYPQQGGGGYYAPTGHGYQQPYTPSYGHGGYLPPSGGCQTWQVTQLWLISGGYLPPSGGCQTCGHPPTHQPYYPMPYDDFGPYYDDMYPTQPFMSEEEAMLWELLPLLLEDGDLGDWGDVDNDDDGWDDFDNDDDDDDDERTTTNRRTISVTDTAETNSYAWDGSNKDITVKGANVGDNDAGNTFNVRDLKNSTVKIGGIDGAEDGGFDKDDKIKVANGDVRIAEVSINNGSGKKFIVEDANGNVITIYTHGDVTLEELKARIIDANGNSLGNNVEIVDEDEITDPEETEEEEETDPERPSWVPSSYSGDYFDEDINRGYLDLNNQGTLNYDKKVVRFNVNTNDHSTYTLDGSQSEFSPWILTDNGTFTYKVNAEQSKLNLIIGHDDWIDIEGDPSDLVFINQPVKTGDTYKVTIFDPHSGNVYEIATRGSNFDEHTKAKILGRFK